ncbi:uncharacterized protein LOC128961388 [Oppia nitens]|uniref:uncharacterized protein LOC128961388 n=1 Tax=Oppia nitens TaxID=1686743 RepID=UPI0023DA1DD5|nr:uncharacterized protein LOC128961388 [Oppia nitens]
MAYNMQLLIVTILLSIFIQIYRSEFVECNFKANDCGIVNGPDMKTRFVYGLATIGGRQQNMLVLDVRSAKTTGARLVTPYYKTKGQLYGCLRIEWYSYGSDSQTLSVTQQDKRDRKLWSSSAKSADWQKSYMNVDLRNGDFRFFIEATVLPGKSGTLAIDNIRFDYAIC